MKPPLVAGERQIGLTVIVERRPVDIAVGDMIAHIRAVRSVSLAALSHDTGLTKSTLLKFERGVERPAPEHLLAIAQALRISVARFFDHIA